jgi:flagellar protein FliT
MDEQLILATYESIAGLTRRMLAAAQASQWDRLTALEKEVSGLFGPLMAHDHAPSAGAEYRRRKAKLIRDILADDAQIRLLLEPRLKDLSVLLGSTRQEQRLARAYETDG